MKNNSWEYVPCPYCHEERVHKGTCQFSLFRSGNITVIVAISTPAPNINFVSPKEPNEQNISP